MGGGIREVGEKQSRSGSFKKLGTGGNRGKNGKSTTGGDTKERYGNPEG